MQKYLLTYYEDDEIRYTQTTKANGEVESTITCQSAMGCEDVSKMLSPSVDIALSSRTNNGKTEINYLYINSSLGTQPKGEKQTQEELLEKGKKLVPIMVEGIDCSSIKYDEKPYEAEGKVKVMETEMPYTLEFTVKASMADADYNVGNYELRIGNCPDEIWED